jgi:hypothetical protein
MPQHVRVEISDPGDLRTFRQTRSHAMVAERLTRPRTEPQRRTVGDGVITAHAKVAVQRPRRLCTKDHDALLVALAVPDDSGALAQIDVSFQPKQLSAAQAAFSEKPQDRLIALVPKTWPLAGPDHRLQLVLVQAWRQRDGSLGCVNTDNGSLGISPSAANHLLN